MVLLSHGTFMIQGRQSELRRSNRREIPKGLLDVYPSVNIHTTRVHNRTSSVNQS